MKLAERFVLAMACVGALGLAGASALGQEGATSRPAASAPARTVPKDLLATEPAFPVVVYTQENAPAAPKIEDLPLKESITRYGITWTFEKPARAGRFVNGDWYVVGPVTVTLIDPKPLYGDEVKDADAREQKEFPGTSCRNGSVLNLPPTSGSGFDSRVTNRRYQPKVSAHLPIAMKPGDALVSSISLPKAGDYCIRSFSVLTCLKDPVPADAFRPGMSDREQTIHLSRNLRRDLLPRLAMPPQPKQPMSDFKVRTFPPNLKDAESPFLRPWIETNFLMADQGDYQGGGYGRGVAEMGGRLVLLLTLDFKPEEKESGLVNYIEYGLDLYSLVKNGHQGWMAHGGWGSGRKLPIVFGGTMLGDEKMASVNKSCPKALFQEDTQAQYDDSWSGAGVVYFGHIGTRILTEDRVPMGLGSYENVHPTRWVDWTGQGYRLNMTSNTWNAEALAVRILQMEKPWGQDAFLDYCDRWMTEPDPGFAHVDLFVTSQGGTWDPFFKAMWTAYRDHLPAINGKTVERPPTGWKKTRELKGPAVEIGKNRELRVGGKPFFPLMVFAVEPNRIDDAAAIGANVIAEGCFEPQVSSHFAATHTNKDFLDKLAAKAMYGVFGADARTIGHPALLGWIHVDEPDVVASRALVSIAKRNELNQKYEAVNKDPNTTDAQRQAARQAFRVARDALAAADPSYSIVRDARDNGNTPWLKSISDSLIQVVPAYEWMKKMDKGRPVFLTVGESFLKAAAEGKKDYCEGYLKNCDVIGCRPLAAQVGEAVAKLRELAPGKPVYAWIETKGVQPAEVRTAVRAALKSGATGIGYRGFEGLKGEKPEAAVLAELKKINEAVAGHAAELLADPAKAEEILK